MLRQLHDGMTACTSDNVIVSEAFAVTNGGKQGCALAPTLLSLIFFAPPMCAYHDERPGSLSPTGRTANSSITGGCISGRVHSQRLSTNFSTPTTALSTPPPKGTFKGSGASSAPRATDSA
ncbi:hypothetical protein SprV_0401593600 [Sparganum proliferum]